MIFCGDSIPESIAYRCKKGRGVPTAPDTFWEYFGYFNHPFFVVIEELFMRSFLKACGFTAWLAMPLMLEAQSTLQYQGVLKENGQPVTAVIDFKATLWDAATNGNQVGVVGTDLNKQVTQGLFTLDLDFGPGAFDGSPLWLQIQLRPDGGGVFQTLSPRQPIQPAPYAHHAYSSSGGGSLWYLTGDNITYEDGDVGIGISSPTARLHVGGAAPSGLGLNINDLLYVNPGQSFVGVNRTTRLSTEEVFGLYADTSNYGGMYIKTSGASGQPFYGYAADNSSMWTYYEGDTNKWHVYNSGVKFTLQSDGRVGIGTTSPQAKLHVDGSIGDGIMFPDGTLQTTAATNTSSLWTENGSNIYYNSGNVGIGDSTPDAALDVEGSSRNAYLAGSTNAVYGEFPDWTYGLLGGSSFGVYGRRVSQGHFGYLGGSAYGAYGQHGTSGNYGRLGTSNEGVLGRHQGTDNEGYLGNADYGVEGMNPSSGTSGYIAGSGNAVFGENPSAGTSGALGNGSYGVIGLDDSGSYGFLGSTTIGVYGYTNSATGAGGVFANAGTGPALIANGRARVEILEIIGGSDLAEPFDINPTDEIETKPGMVVSIDPDGSGELVVSRKAYDRAVAGVISGAGGIRPGMIMTQSGSEADGSVPVALTGRVRVWCDATNGAITPGDLLTTSDRAGHAMTVTDYDKAQGAIIGKAMSSLAEGETGLVLVLVNLQ